MSDKSEIGCRKSRGWLDEAGTGGNGAVQRMFVVLPLSSRYLKLRVEWLPGQKFASQSVIESWKFEFGEGRTASLRHHVPRTVHGITLVSGGVVAGLAYELTSRPFDVARKAVKQYRVIHAQGQGSAMTAVMQKVRQDGIVAFFRDASATDNSAKSPGGASSRRLYPALRTFARVGPWGVGFLVWEAFGPGLS